jgi:transposase
MRKVKDVLRLRFALGLRQDQIARSCSIGQATVHRYLERATAAGLSWPLPEDCDDRRLNELLFPSRPIRPPNQLRAGVDFAEIHRQLKGHKHVTLQLLWEEYCEAQPSGYSYSRFCELYQRWHRDQSVVMRQEHRPGEKTFVDWAGPTVPIHDRHSSDVLPASLFVAVLGASTYTFAQATLSQDLPNWIACHIAAFEYFNGTTQLIVPDNPRTGVTRACRYEPDLNRTYHEMSQHYGVAILPARPYKPRDKAKVENAVLLARWILAALRHERFFALAELNQSIGQLLEKLNHRPFRKREGNRASLFAEVDRPALQPLPDERYTIAYWTTVRANIDYHVEVERHYYSVPYQLAGQHMEARSTATTVEVFHLGKRVASHLRSSVPYHHTVVREHMPKSHQAHLEWTPSRLIHWAETAVGEATAQVVRTILESKPHPEMGYRACLGIMSLGKTYTHPRLEAASQRAVQLQVCSYQSLKSILKRGLDRQTTLALESDRSGPKHENVRGAHYFDPPTTLLQ